MSIFNIFQNIPYTLILKKGSNNYSFILITKLLSALQKNYLELFACLLNLR
jgi:hypothetical protein